MNSIEYYYLFPAITVAVLLLAVPLYHIIAWMNDEHGIRDIPGPKLAALSDVWLGYQAAQGYRSLVVHEVHKKFG